MTCNYRQVMALQKLTADSEKAGLLFLRYVEALTENVMAEQFRYRKKRLDEMRAGVDALIQKAMECCCETDREGNMIEDVWDTTQTAECYIQRRLLSVGIDFRAWREKYRAPDRFHESVRMPSAIELHERRVKYIDKMERKLAVYHGVILMWLHDENRDSFGAVRLLRFYETVRERLNPFITGFLKSSAEKWAEPDEKKLEKMIAKEQAKLERLGIEMEEVKHKIAGENRAKMSGLPESSERRDATLEMYEQLMPKAKI